MHAPITLAPARTAPPGSVVVAVDESRQSRNALAWAARYARSTGVGLHVVHVLRYHVAPGPWTAGQRDVLHTDGADELDHTRGSIRAMFDSEEPEATWTLTFLSGAPGTEVVQFADEAALLAVGTREHQGLDHLLPGSVSHYCLSHATCPVVAVTPPPEGIDADPLTARLYDKELV